MAESRLAHVNLTVVDSGEKVEEFMRWLGQTRRVLGVDTETGGLYPEKHRLRLVQFGDTNHGWAIPFERWGGLAAEVILNYEGEFALHHAFFDVRFLMRHLPEIKRWPWERTHDTMYQARLLFPDRNVAKGLKPLAAIHIDGAAAGADRLLQQTMAREKWTWDTIPIDHPHYSIYSCMDPVLTAHLFEKFEDPVRQQGYQEAYELEVAVTGILARMSHRGTKLDRQYCHDKIEYLINLAQQSREYLQSAFGIENATSNAQVLKALQEQNVELLPKFTSGGKQSLDKEVMEAIQHPIGRYVQAVKRADKWRSSYFESFLEHVWDVDGRVHPTINASEALTARMSITAPAMQTLPKSDDLVRGAFVADEGNVLISSDYNQIELRQMAHFSQDPGLIAAFQSDQAFFVTLGSTMFGRPISKDEPLYGATKIFVYSDLYGAGVEKQAAAAHIHPEEMQAIKDSFNTAYPGVGLFKQKVTAEIERRLATEGEGYIKTPLGRKIWCDPDKPYAGVNYLIQGHAGEVLKRAIVDLDAQGVGDYLLLPIHDEILAEVPRGDAPAVADLIAKTMRRDEYLVPLTSEAKIIEGSWGSAYAKKK